MADKTNETEKLSKITILRGTVFAGAVVEPGTVLDVDDANRRDAEYLIAKGKAVAGAIERTKTSAGNKAVGAAELDKK